MDNNFDANAAASAAAAECDSVALVEELTSKLGNEHSTEIEIMAAFKQYASLRPKELILEFEKNFPQKEDFDLEELENHSDWDSFAQDLFERLVGFSDGDVSAAITKMIHAIPCEEGDERQNAAAIFLRSHIFYFVVDSVINKKFETCSSSLNPNLINILNEISEAKVAFSLQELRQSALNSLVEAVAIVLVKFVGCENRDLDVAKNLVNYLDNYVGASQLYGQNPTPDKTKSLIIEHAKTILQDNDIVDLRGILNGDAQSAKKVVRDRDSERRDSSSQNDSSPDSPDSENSAKRAREELDDESLSQSDNSASGASDDQNLDQDEQPSSDDDVAFDDVFIDDDDDLVLQPPAAQAQQPLVPQQQILQPPAAQAQQPLVPQQQILQPPAAQVQPGPVAISPSGVPSVVGVTRHSRGQTTQFF